MTNIIAIAGYARAGKDTIADYLVKEQGYRKISFADPMREALYKLNPLVRTLEGGIAYLAQIVDTVGWEQAKVITEDFRPMMQRLGTEVGRQMFGENFWVDIAISRIAPDEKIVIADCRFENEANSVRNAGGQVWRVERIGFYAPNNHISEHSLDDYIFDNVFQNNSTIEHLESLVSNYTSLQDA